MLHKDVRFCNYQFSISQCNFHACFYISFLKYVECTKHHTYTHMQKAELCLFLTVRTGSVNFTKHSELVSQHRLWKPLAESFFFFTSIYAYIISYKETFVQPKRTMLCTFFRSDALAFSASHLCRIVHYLHHEFTDMCSLIFLINA